MLVFAVTRLAAPAVSAVAICGICRRQQGWPAILIGGAIAAAGYAAYKIATTTYTQYLDKMRLAQYGFRDYDKWSSDDGAKARYLEDALREYVLRGRWPSQSPRLSGKRRSGS
ncbi:hypothetical protein N5V81_12860 [Escherichia coli]|nr:hypothetical protein [Escherichia coli]